MKEPAAPTADRKPAAVIRRTESHSETTNQWLVRKLLPAWVGSGFVHVLLGAFLLGVSLLLAGSGKNGDEPDPLIVSEADQPEEKPKDLTNPDLGLDPDLPTAVDQERLDDVNVDVKTQSDEPPGVDSPNTARVDVIPPPGVGADSPNPGAVGDAGNVMNGEGGGSTGFSNAAFGGRGAATKSRLLAAGGGNAASEAAVARGLAWLAKQQRKGGNWDYDGDTKDPIASTGMGLLPFLAAGVTHKPGKDPKVKDYRPNVDAGLKFLVSQQLPNGSFKGSSGMYSHAIATVALCEAYGMSGDRALLSPAQKAINFIVGAQGADGSWGYSAGSTGDTSIVGWQIQALHSAKLCKELVVDQRAFEKARKFLDSVASESNKSRYGYRAPGGTPTLTSVGLLCRYYMDGWGPNHPGMAAGVGYLLKTWTPTEGKLDMYYYYYATQVLHFFDGPEWQKDWNPKMRDLLIKLQVGQDKGANAGSWDPDTVWIGPQCGRLGQTCMCLLTLEVYYRHLPLYKRDGAGGAAVLNMVK